MGRRGPNQSKQNCKFVRSNPEKLMMTSVKLELLGNKVGNPAQIVKCWSANFSRGYPRK